MIIAAYHVSSLLEKVYMRYHREEYIYPDPLIFVLKYDNIYDREIAGLIASSLALGRVAQIMSAVDMVLSKIKDPYDDLSVMNFKDLENLFEGFVYRFFKTAEIAGFLAGIGNIIRLHGSIGAYFKKIYLNEKDLLQTINIFSRSFIDSCPSCPGILVTETWKGSACKRFNLFLRWMVRHDNIDPGGWDFIEKNKLIVPLDTHMLRIGRYLGLTLSKSASLKTAVEITDSLKLFDKQDPVRFDFSLTRLGIHPDLTIENLKVMEEEFNEKH